MKNIIIILISLFFYSNSYSQSLILEDNSYIIIEGNGNLIINNVDSNSIKKYGTLGGILTKTEDSKVVLKSVNDFGYYNIPFTSSNGNTIPFIFKITTLGSNYGDLSVSTWETNDSNFIRPLSVTSILETEKVIDRFWSIKLTNYIDKPKGQYILTYDENDIIGNLIDEDNLIAERWNNNLNAWDDVFYNSSINNNTNQVTIPISNPQDEFDIWTLRDYGSLLPLTLVNFKSDCYVEWTTYSEINFSHFILLGSENALDWVQVKSISSNEGSTSINNYRYFPEIKYNYYKLKMVNNDNTYEYSDIIFYNCDYELNSDVVVYPNPTNRFINISGIEDNNYSISIFNEIGLNVLNSKESKLDLIDLESGLYFILINYKNLTITKKVILIK